MCIEGKLVKDRLVISPLVDIDEHTANDLRREIDSLIDRNNFSKLVFDFSNIQFMDSTGIGMILGRYKKLQKLKIGVAVRNANRQIDKVLRASGLYEIFMNE